MLRLPGFKLTSEHGARAVLGKLKHETEQHQQGEVLAARGFG